LLRKIQQKSWLYGILFALTLFAIITFANIQYAKANTGGNDFLINWMGTRAILTAGVSPYSDETALQTQTMVYGEPTLVGQNELRFTSPLYAVFLYFPLALIKNFTLARAVWMSVLEFSLIAIVLLSVRLTYWKVKSWMLGFLILFTFISYHGITPLINGNSAILVTLIILGGLICIRDEKDEFAGILFAISTIQPQIVLLVLVFVLFWAIINHRTKIIAWFLGSMVILIGFSAVIIPDWFVQNFREILRLPSYSPPGSLGAAFIASLADVGQRLAYILTGLLIVLLGTEWWLGRDAGTRRFLWVAFLTLAVSQWIGVQTSPANFILLYPGILFSFSLIDSRWKSRSTLFISLFTVIVTAGIWVLYFTTVHRSYQLIPSSYLFIPLPLLCMILLYWTRWWAVQKSQLNSPNMLDL